MQHEQRRFAVQRIFAKAEARGTPVDGDPNFRKWVDEWIDGHIDVAELRRRYNQLATRSYPPNVPVGLKPPGTSKSSKNRKTCSRK
jgi:hypothetical protein